MTRIAYLAPASVVHTVRWVNALAERGHEVHLYTAHPSDPAITEHVCVHELPVAAPAGYILNTSFLRRELDKLAPAFLHVHYASGYGTLGQLSGYRPRFLSVWGSDVFDFPEESSFHRALVARNLQNADAVISISHVMARRVKELAAAEQSVEIVPWGVDTDKFFPTPGEQSQERLTIGTVKKLTPKYGIDVLMRAFAQCLDRLSDSTGDAAGEPELVLVGAGPSRKGLERLALELGIANRTIFTGEIPHEDVPDMLRRLDIYVAVSRLDSESFGVSVLEASACGVPVIVSDAGGLPEVVDDGRTGLIVPAEDVEATATAIEKLASDMGRRKRFGEAGRAWVQDKYEWNRCVDRMDTIYRRLLSKLYATDPSGEEQRLDSDASPGDDKYT